MVGELSEVSTEEREFVLASLVVSCVCIWSSPVSLVSCVMWSISLLCGDNDGVAIGFGSSKVVLLMEGKELGGEWLNAMGFPKFGDE
jgi:hypothetical protein